jgi:hypothetical protein
MPISTSTQESTDSNSNFEVSLLRLPPGPYTLWTLHMVLNFERRTILDLEVFPDATAWELKCLVTRELVHRSKQKSKEAELRAIAALSAVSISLSSSSAEWNRSELVRKTQLLSPTPTPHEVTLGIKGQCLDGGSLASYGVAHLSTIEVDLRMGSTAAASSSSSSCSPSKRQVIIQAGLPLSTRIAAAEGGVVDSRPLTPPNTAFHPTLAQLEGRDWLSGGQLPSISDERESSSTSALAASSAGEAEPAGEVTLSVEGLIEKEMLKLPQRRYLSTQLVLTLKALASAPYGVEEAQLAYFWKRIERGVESLGFGVDPKSGLDALQLSIIHARNPNLPLLLLQQRDLLGLRLSRCSDPRLDSAEGQPTRGPQQVPEDRQADEVTLPLLLLARRCLRTIPSPVRTSYEIDIQETGNDEPLTHKEQVGKEKRDPLRMSVTQLEDWLLLVKVLPALVLPPNSPSSLLKLQICEGQDTALQVQAGLEWMPPIHLREKVQRWYEVCYRVLLEHPDLFHHAGFATEHDRQRMKEAMKKISQLSLLPPA